MTNEIWRFFSHRHDEYGRYDLESLHDCEGKLTLRLSNEVSETISIEFDACLAYRKMDEGDALESLRCRPPSLSPATIYVVDNSSFVDWFVKQGYNIRERDDLTHYLVASVNDIVDVISLEPPNVVPGNGAS